MKKASPMIKGSNVSRSTFFSGRLRQRIASTMGIGLISLAILTLGCSSPPQTGSSEPTKKEIRSDADRFFNKVEKEENKQDPKKE